MFSSAGDRLTDKRRLLRGRQGLSYRHEEHGHGEQRADPQGHLLSRLGRHVEHQQGCNNNDTKLVLTARKLLIF